MFLTVTDIFKNQLIQYLINTANLRHLTSHSTPFCPTTQRSRCDHRSLRRHFTLWREVTYLLVWQAVQWNW